MSSYSQNFCDTFVIYVKSVACTSCRHDNLPDFTRFPVSSFLFKIFLGEMAPSVVFSNLFFYTLFSELFFKNFSEEVFFLFQNKILLS
jgi:hypothetical protein